MVGALEAKYVLTRNDPTFDIDLSEQDLICDANQGGLDIPFTTGMCTAAELPYIWVDTSPLYPLQPGWQQRVVVSTSEIVGVPYDVASVKTN